MQKSICRSLAVLFFATTLVAQAHIQMPAVFSDNMVLQQGTRVTVWGWADEGDKITVTFRGQKVSTTTHNLKWSVQLKALKAGGPDVLTVATDDHRLQFANVLVGEVWICSGQSNMEWPVSASTDAAGTAAAATNSLMRVFNVPNVKAESPTVRIKGTWQTVTPQNVPGMTAVGYHFGRELQAARKVPVGLIQSDWGGSPAEAWMSREALEINDRYRAEILEPYFDAQRKHADAVAAQQRDKQAAEKKGEKFDKPIPAFVWWGWKPAELYNGMIAPLAPYTIKGAIWYQGESNAGRAEQYRTLFPDMIRNWRRDWGQGDFPFLLVQLAPFKAIKDLPEESDWAELREAQWLTTKNVPNTAMAVITDVGDPKDIHPKQKQPVGARLALAARAVAYGEKIPFSGPQFRALEIKGSRAVVRFDHVGKGLEARGGELKGFAVCGEDRKFHWAQAKIEGATVVVSCEKVAKPVAVRYAWADCPVVNFWNQDGLPAVPFRTDNFPMITADKK